MKHLYRYSFSLITALAMGSTAASAQCPVAAACTPGPASSAQATAFGMGIFNVTVGSINNTTAGNADGYRDYGCTQGTTLDAGLTYAISIQTNANTNENVRVWLDWNNDGAFSPTTELFFSSSNARTHTGLTAALPPAAVTGQPLRLRIAADGATAPLPTPCSTPQYSQVEDYRVTLQANAQAPTAAFTLNPAQACAGTFAFLDQSNRQPTSWRWTFGDGTGSTQQNPTHTYALPGTYTAQLRTCNAFGCDSSQQTVTFFASYPAPASCQPTTLGYCCNYGVTRFDFGDLSQVSSDGRTGYEDYSCTRRATVTQGQTVPLHVTTTQPQDTWVYLDANNDGLFTPNELLYQALNKTSPQAFLVLPRTLPTNQPLRLRVVSDAVGSPGAAAPCAARTSGQVEDYAVVVTPVPCPATVQGGQVEFFYTTAQSFAPDSVASALLLTRHTPGAAIQWERSPVATPPVWQALPGRIGPSLYYKRLVTAPDSLYRAVVTCGAAPVPSTNVVPTTFDSNTRYRLHTFACGAASSLHIRQVRLAGTLLDNPTACVGSSGPAYQLFSPARPTTTATVLRGETYELEVTTTLSCRLTVFVETPGRAVRLPVLRVPATVANGPTRLFLKLDSLLLPAATAVLRLRIRCEQDALRQSPVDYTTELNSGETEDYLLRVVPFACSRTVVSGRITASAAAQCPRDTVRLTLLGTAPGSRLQWQRSADSLAWQPVAGQTGRVFASRPGATTYYRVLVQGCAGTATTPVVRVRVQPLAECYCAAPLAVVPAAAPVITRVTIVGTTLDNPSPGASGGPGLVLYAPTPPSRTAELVRGAAYTLRLTVANSGAGAGALLNAAAWLDLDRNGSYDSLEWVHLVRTAATGAATYQATLPVGVWALLGPAGLRLRVGNNVAYRPSGGCAAAALPAGQGETEEYTVTLVAAPCRGPLTAGVVDIQRNTSGVCRSRLRSTAYTPGAALQWQSSPGGVAWTDIAGARADEYAAWAATSTFYRLRAVCGIDTAYSPPVQMFPSNNTVPCGCAADDSFGFRATNAYVDDVEIVGTPLVNVGSGIQVFYTSPPSTSFRRTVGYWAPQTAAFTATLLRGSSYSLRLAAVGEPGQFSPTGTSVGAWIDWNHNGAFDSNEFHGAPPNGLGRVNYTTSLAVPATAALGTTQMRVVAAGGLLNTQGCASSYDSETEDYFLTVADQAPLAVPVLSAGPLPLCQGATLQLGASGAGPGARVDWLGPAGYAAANTSAPTRAGITAAHGGTYIAVVTRNGERLLTSLYVPVDTCRAVLTTRALTRSRAVAVYPNPTTGLCTVRLPAAISPPGHVMVRNTTGQLVPVPAPTLSTGADGLEIVLDLRLLPQGLYLLEIGTGQGNIFAKVMRE